MSKVICDICGTVYQDTADSCPICGYSQIVEEDIMAEELLEDTGRVKAGRFAQNRKNREYLDYDEDELDEEYEDEEDEDDYDEDEDSDAPRSNTGLVIFLVVVIMLLLAAIGYVFFRYFLPNMGGNDDANKPGISLVSPEETETEPTTEPTIPCDSIVLTGGMAELSREGQYWLLHVKVMPEDTTDDLIFISEDESIATVTQDGKITATGEGETTIYITCGKQQINCPVIVSYQEETQGTEAANGEASTEETTETSAPELLDVELALIEYDITLPVGYGVTLQLDCPLEASDVQWSVEHPHIATVNENGFVKAIGYGTTAVIVKYGSQEVTCLIRCK